MKLYFLAIALFLLIGGGQGISVSISADGGTISQVLESADNTALSSQALVSESGIFSETMALGRSAVTIGIDGGDAKFQALVEDEGFEVSQIATSEGVGGEIRGSSGRVLFSQDEVQEIGSGDLGKEVLGVTDSGATFHYTSLPYYTGLDYGTEWDSSDSATVYVKNENAVINGITITGSQVAQSAYQAGMAWNTATGHQYIANIYLTTSPLANFGAGNNGVNSISWYSQAGGNRAESSIWYNPANGRVTTRKIGLNKAGSEASSYTIPAFRKFVLEHELGHSYVGLMHSSDPAAIMFPTTANYQSRQTPTWNELQIAMYKRDY